MTDSTPLPHCGVHVRIGRSKIHGVGVIDIVPIAKGTDLFPSDRSELSWIKADDLPVMPRAHRQMNDDICICIFYLYVYTINVNDMTISLYLNHSETPNVECDREYRFFALLNFREGEELTVDYRTFSQGTLPSSTGRKPDD